MAISDKCESQGEIIPANYSEERFEFPLWQLIKKVAEEKDISYSAACEEAVIEYSKTLRIRDQAWNDAEIEKRDNELAAMLKQYDNDIKGDQR